VAGPRIYTVTMLRDRTAKDLLLLSLVKVAAIAAIYYLCFAAYDGRPVDAVSHLLGPAGAVHALKQG
jgi:hypothetical protein